MRFNVIKCKALYLTMKKKKHPFYVSIVKIKPKTTLEIRKRSFRQLKQMQLLHSILRQIDSSCSNYNFLFYFYCRFIQLAHLYSFTFIAVSLSFEINCLRYRKKKWFARLFFNSISNLSSIHSLFSNKRFKIQSRELAIYLDGLKQNIT